MPDTVGPLIAALAPAGWWRCQDALGTTLLDSSGNGKTLTLPSSAGIERWQIPGIPGGAPYAVDWTPTVNGYADRPTNADFQFASGASFTLLCWLLSNANQAWEQGLILKGSANLGDNFKPWYELGTTLNGAPFMWLRTTAGVDHNAIAAPNISDASVYAQSPWHLVAGVYDSSAGTVAINVDGQTLVTSPGVPADTYGTNAGRFTVNKAGGKTTGMWICDYAVIPSAVPTATLSAIYEAGRAGAAWYESNLVANYQALTASLAALSVDVAALSTDLAAILAAVRRTF